MNTIKRRISGIFRIKHILVKNILHLRKKQPNHVHNKAICTGKTEISGKTTCGNITTTELTADVTHMDDPT